ncbi:MAG: hypothetical protein KIT34_03130 [Cyanobacteria bacterium TGS_CYA1]|nr:hypothetical protein [Cyanobacteria bacterium TGS_CYA1]
MVFSIEYGDNQPLSISDLSVEINALGTKVYGVETAFPVEILTDWLEKCPQGFYILRKERELAGYLYAMPISQKEFAASLEAEYDEQKLFKNGLGSEGVQKPYKHYLFSSLVVAPRFQEKTPASRLLRLAFINRVIEWRDPLEPVYISAQALSKKGERCAQSLMMKNIGATSKNWIIYSAALSSEDLYSIQSKLQNKIKERE